MRLLYGSAETQIEHVASRLADHLGPGEPHESFYWGGDYYLWQAGDAEIRLHHNRELADELSEPDHPDYPILFRISGADASEPWDAIALNTGLVRLV